MTTIDKSATTRASTAASGALTPAASAPAKSALGGPVLGKTDFLKMLVAQLKNQDPLNPTQGTEMAAQLAQFSSVEQLMQLNAKLDSQATASQATTTAVEQASAFALVGRRVLIESNALQLHGKAGTQSLSVQAPAGGGVATLQVLDAQGRVAATQTLSLTGGEQDVALGPTILGLPAGRYTTKVTMQATNAQIPTALNLDIDGVEASANGPILTSGAYKIPMSALIAVRQAAASAITATGTSAAAPAAGGTGSSGLSAAIAAAAAQALKLAF